MMVFCSRCSVVLCWMSGKLRAWLSLWAVWGRPTAGDVFFFAKKEKRKESWSSHIAHTLLYMNLSIFVFKRSCIYLQNTSVSSSGLNGMHESVQLLHQWPDLTVSQLLSHCLWLSNTLWLKLPSAIDRWISASLITTSLMLFSSGYKSWL